MTPVKFTFDKSFDAGTGQRHEEELAALRTQGEQEKAAAHQAGFEAGHAQAMGEIESATIAVLEQIQNSATNLFNEFHSIQGQISQQSAQIAHVVGLQLAESLMQTAPLSEIEGILNIVFDEIRNQPQLIIRVNPDVAAAIEEKIQMMKNQAAFQGELTLLPDSSFNPQDITVEWGEGGMRRNYDEIIEKIQHCVSQYIESVSKQATMNDDAVSDAAQ